MGELKEKIRAFAILWQANKKNEEFVKQSPERKDLQDLVVITAPLLKTLANDIAIYQKNHEDIETIKTWVKVTKFGLKLAVLAIKIIRLDIQASAVLADLSQEAVDMMGSIGDEIDSMFAAQEIVEDAVETVDGDSGEGRLAKVKGWFSRLIRGKTGAEVHEMQQLAKTIDDLSVELKKHEDFAKFVAVDPQLRLAAKNFREGFERLKLRLSQKYTKLFEYEQDNQIVLVQSMQTCMKQHILNTRESFGDQNYVIDELQKEIYDIKTFSHQFRVSIANTVRENSKKYDGIILAMVDQSIKMGRQKEEDDKEMAALKGQMAALQTSFNDKHPVVKRRRLIDRLNQGNYGDRRVKRRARA